MSATQGISSEPHRILHSVRAAGERAIGIFERWYCRRIHRRGGRLDGHLDVGLRAIARQYARLELPGHIAMLNALLINRPQYWKNAGIATCRGCWHGYRLRLDLDDFFQRRAYFCGRYHEVALQVLMRRAVRPGDTFVDGGANNGLVALVAAWLVGPSGQVITFEPNPVAARQLRWHIRANRLRHVHIWQAGLSHCADELELAVPGGDNLGAGTFAPLPVRYAGFAQQRCHAQLVRGDEVLGDVLGPMMIKLDVEGYEVKALCGLRNTIRRHRPLVFAETNTEMLSMADTDIPTMYRFMEELGYQAYVVRAIRNPLRRRGLRLNRWRPGEELPPDLLWMHPEGRHYARLERYIVATAG